MEGYCSVYSDGSPAEHEWRARLRLEGKLALSRATLAEDRTLWTASFQEG